MYILTIKGTPNTAAFFVGDKMKNAQKKSTNFYPETLRDRQEI